MGARSFFRLRALLGCRLRDSAAWESQLDVGASMIL